MIKIFNNYYDKNNKRFQVLDFSNGMYLCEYVNGKRIYLTKKDMFKEPIKENIDKIITPDYFREKMVKEKPSKDKLNKVIKKVVNEEVEKEVIEDFYKDL